MAGHAGRDIPPDLPVEILKEVRGTGGAKTDSLPSSHPQTASRCHPSILYLQPPGSEDEQLRREHYSKFLNLITVVLGAQLSYHNAVNKMMEESKKAYCLNERLDIRSDEMIASASGYPALPIGKYDGYGSVEPETFKGRTVRKR